jgi:hypothetical protein
MAEGCSRAAATAGHAGGDFEKGFNFHITNLLKMKTTKILLLLALLFSMGTLPAQAEWRVARIRGEIRADGQVLQVGSHFSDAQRLEFANTHDVMAVYFVRGRASNAASQLVMTDAFLANHRIENTPCHSNCEASWMAPTKVKGGSTGAVDGPGYAVRMDAVEYWEQTGLDNYQSPPPAFTPLSSQNMARAMSVSMSLGNKLSPNATLLPGQYLLTANGQYKLIYQTDGNLVLYRTSDNYPLWSSGTAGQPAGRCVMQTDGNLVIYRPDNVPIWNTGTWEAKYNGSHLELSEAGDLLVLSPASKVWWQSGTWQGTINSSPQGHRPDLYEGYNWPRPGHPYKIKSAVGEQVLEVLNSNNTPGTTVQTWSSHGGTGQRWLLNLTNGYYTIQSALGNYLDVQWGSVNAGTPVWLWDFNGGGAQQWVLVPAGNGWFYIRSVLGTYLDVQNGANANGTPVWMYSFNGSPAQLWRFDW